jgi:hypothetical protein
MRFQSGGYGTSLPPDINGTFRSKRSVRNPTPVPAWLFSAVAVLLLALVIWSTSQRKPVHEQVSVPEPIATPTVVIPRESAAPRAVLIKLPPPRATLVRLPEWRVDTERELLMPYGLKVSAHLRGSLASTDMLPTNGNEVGHTWVVGDTAWVWLTAPGTARAEWIDP